MSYLNQGEPRQVAVMTLVFKTGHRVDVIEGRYWMTTPDGARVPLASVTQTGHLDRYDSMGLPAGGSTVRLHAQPPRLIPHPCWPDAADYCVTWELVPSPSAVRAHRDVVRLDHADLVRALDGNDAA